MYDEDHEKARQAAAIGWGLHVFHAHPDLFACWCLVDKTNIPWALGLFDEGFSDTINIYGRHGALITSPVLTLEALPVCRADFHDAGWEDAVCLTVEHYSGMEMTFHYFPDCSVRESSIRIWTI